MGSGSTTHTNENPIHTVNITKDFYVGKYEVTQGEWEKVMGSNPSNFSSCGAKCPVENVSWNDVQTFITKLNEKEGTSKYRLLTEAEWEYTARGGNQSKGYTHSGSNDINEVAWYYSNSSETTHEVGGKNPNELGIYDMSGNVFEWVQDYYSANYYSNSPSDDPKNTTVSVEKVLRGGSWRNDSDYCRVALRFNYNPVNSHDFIGFRVAKSL